MWSILQKGKDVHRVMHTQTKNICFHYLGIEDKLDQLKTDLLSAIYMDVFLHSLLVEQLENFITAIFK